MIIFKYRKIKIFLIIFFKSFWHALAILGFLPKLKRDLGLAFGAHFLHTFSIKIFHTSYSINWQSFIFRPEFVLKISNKMFLNSYLDNWWSYIFYNLSLNHLLEQWLTEGKRWQEENTKITKKQKSLKNKKIFPMK